MINNNSTTTQQTRTNKSNKPTRERKKWFEGSFNLGGSKVTR